MTKNLLSITSLQTEFLNIDSSSVSGKKNKGANIVKTKSTFCGGSKHSEKKQKRKRNDREKFRTADNQDKQRTEHTPRCGYVDHIIAKFPKPPKDNKKQWKQVRLNERGNPASQKNGEWW